MMYDLRARNANYLCLRTNKHALEIIAVALAMTLWTKESGLLWLPVFFAPLLVIDAHAKRLLDILTLPLLALSIGYAIVASNDLALRLSGGLYLIFGLWATASIGERIYGKTMLGGGDIKLLACFPFLIGFFEAMIALLVACILQIIIALVVRATRNHAMPMGPALIVGFYVAMNAL